MKKHQSPIKNTTKMSCFNFFAENNEFFVSKIVFYNSHKKFFRLKKNFFSLGGSSDRFFQTDAKIFFI